MTTYSSMSALLHTSIFHAYKLLTFITLIFIYLKRGIVIDRLSCQFGIKKKQPASYQRHNNSNKNHHIVDPHKKTASPSYKDAVLHRNI